MAKDDDNGGSEELNFDPRDLLRTARDYWMLALILAGPLAFAFHYWKSREVPVFTASALVLFEIASEQVVNIEEVIDTTVSGAGSLGMENYLAHLRSRAFLQEVLDSLTEAEIDRIVQPYVEEDAEEDEAPSALFLLQRGMKIVETGMGTTVQISVSLRDPEIAAMMANRITERFSVFISRRASRANEAAVKFLMTEADDLRRQVRESDLVLQKYREDNNVISLEESLNLVNQQLLRVSAATSEAYLDRVQAEGVFERAIQALEVGEPIAKIPAVMGYSNIRDTVARINQLEGEVAILGLRYGKRHPVMVEKLEVLDLTRKQLEQLVSECREYLSGQAIATSQRHDRLLAEQNGLERKSLELDRLGIEYNVLRRRYDSQKTTYDRIVGRLNETMISSKLVQSPVRVVDIASIPAFPSSPNPKRILLTSVGLFVVGFSGIIGLFAVLDRRIRSGQMIEDQMKVELLGEIPQLKGVSAKKRPFIVREEPDPGMAEPFRSLCGKILLMGRSPKPKKILVTSTGPGEGKSLFCSNFAFALREQGSKVLLVNADYRAPALDELLGDVDIMGSADWYLRRGEVPPADNLLRNFVVSFAAGVDFLPVGGGEVRPQEILADPVFMAALDHLCARYDVAIFDAPPGLVFHDAITLANWVQETVVIARYLKVNVSRLKRLFRALEKTRSQKLGVVFNGVPKAQSSGDYYRHAKYYHSRARKRTRKAEKRSRAESEEDDDVSPSPRRAEAVLDTPKGVG
jgi:polysaccharide biosynthesis transport protein